MTNPLFIPLKKQYYEAFERGDKTHEFRAYGPRWNERTCYAGREVILSCGYGKQRRMRGRIASASIMNKPSPAFLEIYGPDKQCFGIEIALEG